VPSDYHLFTSLKKHMGGKKCSTNEEVKKWSTNGQRRTCEFYEASTKKCIYRLTTCIEKDGDSVEK